MRVLHVDLETYSEAPLADVGARKYAEDPSTEIILCAYALDGGPVTVVDLARGENGMGPVWAVLGKANKGDLVLAAHNAAFERNVLSVYLRRNKAIRAAFGIELGPDGMLPTDRFYCTMVRAYQLGLPGSLERAGNALGIKAEDRKMAAEGKRLIKLFCTPDRKRGRVRPEDEPEKWARFVEYNRQDIVAERAVFEAERLYPEQPAVERTLYAVDQAINDRGVAVDLPMAKTVAGFVQGHTQNLLAQAKGATEVENPNSLVQIKAWLAAKGVEVDKLDKDTVAELLKDKELDPEVRAYLIARKELGKTSVAKYEAMVKAALWDPRTSSHRLHGMLQFDGAIRTGRWAGRIVQMQNLPHDSPIAIDDARELARTGDFEMLEILYGAPMDTLSQLIRTAFVPTPGHRFVVADYAQIESRVAAWMTGETWKLEAFRSGKDIYKVNASRMYGKPIDEIGHDERAKGKVAELAGGYGGGVGAYKRFGADTKLGLSDSQIQSLVMQWRASNPLIVAAWRQCEEAFRAAILNPGTAYRLGTMPAYAKMHRDSLLLMLPSKRFIAYKGMRIQNTENGRRFMYKDTSEKSAAVLDLETYGGKIFENLIQGVARDCLAEALIRLERKGCRTVFHVHDEVIVEAPAAEADAIEETVCGTMALQDVPWLSGCPLRAESYQCDYYVKK